MRLNNISRFVVTTALVIGVACAAPGARAASKTSPSETAIQAAAKQNRYAIVTFYKQNDAASTKMLAEARKLQGKYTSRANIVIADVENNIHQSLISKYGADRSPMPLTLVIAPNGAVTAAFPNVINITDLSDAFVSIGWADVLKVLQNGKLAVMSLQNAKTTQNKESLAVAESLNYQAQFSGMVEVVKIDPSDSSEAKFLQQCKVDTSSASAQLVVIVPPGRIVGTFDGTATADLITSTIMKSMSSGGCGGGTCGSGGCK